jgi:hypothetical protein
MGSLRALAEYAKMIRGDKYASQLIKLGWGDYLCTLDIANIRQYAGVTQMFHLLSTPPCNRRRSTSSWMLKRSVIAAWLLRLGQRH